MAAITLTSTGGPVSIPCGSVTLKVQERGKAGSPPELQVSERRVSVAENATSLNPQFAEGEPKAATTKVAVHCTRKFGAYVQGGVAEEEADAASVHGCRTVLVTDWQRNLGAVRTRVAVEDLAFAYDAKDVVLAVVDVFGDVLVVSVTSEGLQALVNVQVEARGSVATHCHMVRWCPFIPADGQEYLETCDPVQQRYSRLLLVTNNAHAEVWSIDKLQQVAEKIDGHKLNLSEVTVGRTQTDCPSSSLPIVDAAVALDGSSFATLYGDGSICFWEFDEPLIHGKAPACRKRIAPPEGTSLQGNEEGFHFIFFPDDLTPRKGTEDELFWTSMVVGTGKTIRVYNMENWSVVQTVTMEAAQAWQVCKDPLGKCLMMASQQHNSVMFFSVDSQDEDQACTLTTATLLQSPRIFQYADILFRAAVGSVGKQLKGHDEVKRVKFAGFSNTGLRFCELGQPKPSAPTTPSAVRSHSPKDIVIVRKARLETDDASSETVKRETPVAARRKDVAMPNPIKPKTPVVQPMAKPEEKAKSPPKCEISLSGLRVSAKSAFVPVKKSQPEKSLEQIEKELAAGLESPVDEVKPATPDCKPEPLVPIDAKVPKPAPLMPIDDKATKPVPLMSTDVKDSKPVDARKAMDDLVNCEFTVKQVPTFSGKKKEIVVRKVMSGGEAEAELTGAVWEGPTSFALNAETQASQKPEIGAGDQKDSPDSSMEEKKVVKSDQEYWELASFNLPGRTEPMVCRYPRNARQPADSADDKPSDVHLPIDKDVQESGVSSSYTEVQGKDGGSSSSSGGVSLKTHAALAVNSVDNDDKVSSSSASTADVQEMIKAATKTAVHELNKNYKMDQIKMTHSVAKTIKSEFAKLKTEEGGGGSDAFQRPVGGARRRTMGGEGDVSPPQGGGSGHHFQEFTRVHEILATVQAQIQGGQYDKAWMTTIGKKVDDLLLLDIRDMIAKAKQQDR